MTIKQKMVSAIRPRPAFVRIDRALHALVVDPRLSALFERP
jgi:hypothetical protein